MISQVNNGLYTSRVSQDKGNAMLELWNSDCGKTQQYKQYTHFRGLRARLNEDRKELDKLKEKAAGRAKEAKKAQAAGNGKASLRGTKR